MSSEQLRREGRAAAKLAYEEGNGLVALYLVVERAVELEERIEELEEALREVLEIVGGWTRPLTQEEKLGNIQTTAWSALSPSEATRSEKEE